MVGEGNFFLSCIIFILDLSFYCWRVFAIMALLLVPSSRLYDRHAWQKRNSWRPITLIRTSLEDSAVSKPVKEKWLLCPVFCFSYFVCNSFLLVYLASKSMLYFKRDGHVSLCCLHLNIAMVMPLGTVLTLRKLRKFSYEGEKHHFRQFCTQWI